MNKPNSKQSKHLMILVLLIIAFFLPIILLLLDRNNQLQKIALLKSALMYNTPSPTLVVNSMNVNLFAEDPTVSPGGTITVLADLEPVNDLAAFDIRLKYNPDQLSALALEPGQLWSDQNIIIQEIDNNAGLVRLSVGQVADATMTGELNLVSIDFSVNNLASGVTTISITNESKASVLGEDTAYLLDADPLNVQILDDDN